MQPTSDTYHDESDDTPSSNADVEAQSLLHEELGFEDNVPLTRETRTRKRGIFGFLEGPSPPRVQVIRPFFPGIQEKPEKLIARWCPSKTRKITLLAAVLTIWFIVFASFLTSELPIPDGTGEYVQTLSCTDTLWRRKNECGIDGIDCRPFSNTTYAFRCPAKCRDVRVLNPRVIGPLEVNYRPLVVGSGPYRGDSFICGSALHAGVVSESQGGCGRLRTVGTHSGFASTARHGIESIPFDSYFPVSFTVEADGAFTCPSDPRSPLLFLSLLVTALLSVFSSTPTIFYPIFILTFTHVAFISDPPSTHTPTPTTLPDHTSLFARRLLPALFTAAILYKTTIRKTLLNLAAPLEKTTLWLGGLWIGALSNYTFEWIPISRLTAHDLAQQPGAKVALALILISLVFIIAGQVYFFWLAGRLPRYLALYALFVAGILIAVALPGVELRIHHYILALLLLPGTAMQNRASLLYQGILLGLFINGVARWDFDAVLQTSDALRGDARLDSPVPPVFEPRVDGATALFSWDGARGEGVQGLSVLVNDVERFRGFYEDGALREWAWVRGGGGDEYFRFAYLGEGGTGDYSGVGVWAGGGSWMFPKNTPTKENIA
ncbi:hypothetical protein P153DRAFT_425982 [Dothidotthia symphoricarpi CBS 119687]|uniref:LCCL domain-containing protein n=1 Tax=Dothidotthia symphoricarpi CBS 119687 TaxID=1392245 RepID=A0A6A6A180_9PLEO|nr:uncharacterized protein P153DRAFT_425982 [Dothidotthia symphoricarpi CBS 119687]KAF2124923.1 hypothetical protein P153DRAFT_425982 [Dothidotthia symphoricarpi CBS 119687]